MGETPDSTGNTQVTPKRESATGTGTTSTKHLGKHWFFSLWNYISVTCHFKTSMSGKQRGQVLSDYVF